MRVSGLKFVLAAGFMFAVSAVFLTDLEAATVYLKDGGKIRGTIVGATAQYIQVNTPDGVLRINSDRISKVDYQEGAATPEMSQPTPPPAMQQPPVPVRQGYTQEFAIEFGITAALSQVSLASAGGGSTDNGSAGALLGLQYLFKSGSNLSFGLCFEFLDRGLNDSFSLLPDAHSTVSGNSVILMPILKYFFNRNERVRPYILAGIGVDRTSTFIDAHPIFGFTWSDTLTDETRTLVDDANWGMTSMLRVGVEFLQYYDSFFAFELGWTGITNGKFLPTTAGQRLGINDVTGNISELIIGGKWGWRF